MVEDKQVRGVQSVQGRSKDSVLRSESDSIAVCVLSDEDACQSFVEPLRFGVGPHASNCLLCASGALPSHPAPLACTLLST